MFHGHLLQEVLRKHNPSSVVVLYGCAAASPTDFCSSRTDAGLDFEWAQVTREESEAATSVEILNSSCSRVHVP